MVIKIKSIFDKSEDEGLDCRELDPKTGEFKYVTRTKQADKEACDINNILKRYEKTGQLPDMIREDGRYGDFSNPVTLQEAFEIVNRAEAQFMALSARVRERFGNDPVQMLEFCANSANVAEMVELGLAIAPPQPANALQNAEPAGSGTPASEPAGKKGA